MFYNGTFVKYASIPVIDDKEEFYIFNQTIISDGRNENYFKHLITFNIDMKNTLSYGDLGILTLKERVAENEFSRFAEAVQVSLAKISQGIQ